MTTPPAELLDLATILAGQYDIVREVGRGGMGVVYLARDLKLDRDVAIKTLPPHLADNAEIRERFLREARTAAALAHPNIVPIHRADEINGRVFFVMGYVDGESLAQTLRTSGPPSPRRVAEILIDVASALAYAHDHGVIHRDVKAENILLDAKSGRAMVTDFGIARLAEAKPLTQTGSVLGTVYYMSPEQVSGDTIDGRSDLYALGVAGFLSLSGHFPFESDTPSAVLVAHVTRRAPLLRSLAPHVPDSLAQLIDRCLAKDPAERFDGCRTFANAVNDVVNRLPDTVPSLALTPLLMSETEAQAVWARAAALQAATGAVVPPPEVRFADRNRPASATSAYSLTEVEAGASGAGIGAQYVSRAIAELGLSGNDATPAANVVRPGNAPPKNFFLGEATSVAFEASIEGEMDPRDFDVLTDCIRRALGDSGHMAAVGRSLTWSSSDRQRKVAVSVLVRGGRTTVHVTERLKDLAGGLFGGIMGGGGGGMIGPSIGIGVNAFHSWLAALGMAVGTIGLAYTIARTIYTRMTGSRRKVLERLTHDLVELARESMRTSALPPTRDPRRLGR
ncbi:MAG: serine/threonine-protein kinase [Gemmatimonadaceae bacterium]